MPKYGLISQTDAGTLEKTADLICEEFPNEAIEFTEIGLYAGLTGNSLTQYFTSKKVASWWIGIDNFKDNEKLIHTPDKLIIGNSNEVYNQLKDNSQHMVFVDGCHCFAHVVSDFFCYADKVKVGGYFAWHDTGNHILQMKDFQHGDKNNPDAYISVRKALSSIGLFGWENPYVTKEAANNFRKTEIPYEFNIVENKTGISIMKAISNWIDGQHPMQEKWMKVFDEADIENLAGGITVFKKIF